MYNCKIYGLKKKCDLVSYLVTDKVIHRGTPLLKIKVEISLNCKMAKFLDISPISLFRPPKSFISLFAMKWLIWYLVLADLVDNRFYYVKNNINKIKNLGVGLYKSLVIVSDESTKYFLQISRRAKDVKKLRPEFIEGAGRL